MQQVETNLVRHAQELIEYYSATRQVGHTTAAIEGAKSTSALLVTSTQRQADMLRFEVKSVPLSSFEQVMRGRRDPIVLDNKTVYDFLVSLVSTDAERKKLESKLIALEWYNTNLRRERDFYTDQVVELLREVNRLQFELAEQVDEEDLVERG